MEELYESYMQVVYRFLWAACRDGPLAEELTQETFLRAFQSLDRFDGSCKLSTWLCRIARHVYLQYLEKRGREASEALDEAFPSEDDTERQALSRISLEDALEALERLPEAARRVVYLRAMAGLSFREVGAALGRSENWARVTFYRAKEKLIKEVGGFEL